jgi:hypothetical protein
MTLREMCDSIGIDDNPFECAFCIAALLRSSLQREPSTFEGECATLVEVTKLIGRVDQPETIRRWLGMLKAIPDMEVPDSTWLSIVNADLEDDENEEQTTT